jgi:hypothetical protein
MLLLFVPGNHQNYQKGLYSDQLMDVGSGGGGACVGDASESVDV